MVRTRAQRKETGDELDTEYKKQSLGSQYNTLMARYPFVMNEVQSTIITCSAVMSSSVISGTQQNWGEVVTMAIVTLTLITPVLMQWFGYLNRSGMPLVPQLLVDQLVFSPILTSAILIWRSVVSNLITTQSFDLATVSSLPAEVIPIIPGIMIKSWCFWIPIRLLILKFIPPMHHVVLGSLFSFLWNIILALALK
jgi:hypothetical protein